MHYLHHTLKKELSALYVNTMLRGFAAGMMGLFTPLYFYKLGFSVSEILFFLVVSYLIFALFVIPGAHFTVRMGHEKTIAWSTPLLLVYFLILYYLPGNHALFLLAALVLGVHNGIYWVAYHSEFARFADHNSVGEEIGYLKVFITIISVIAPALAGIFIESWGFPMLFFISTILIVLSVIPVLATPEKWTSGTVSSFRILQMFKAPKLRKDLVGMLATGEDSIASTVWPIYIYLIIPSYRDLGILTALTIFLGLVIFLWIGKLANLGNRGFLIKRMTGFLTFSWLFRMFAFTPLTILASDTIYKLSANSLSIPLTTLVYLRPKRQQLIEYTAFWMGSLALGKALAALAAIIILLFTDNLAYTFLLAALISLFYFSWNDVNK